MHDDKSGDSCNGYKKCQGGRRAQIQDTFPATPASATPTQGFCRKPGGSKSNAGKNVNMVQSMEAIKGQAGNNDRTEEQFCF